MQQTSPVASPPAAPADAQSAPAAAAVAAASRATVSAPVEGDDPRLFLGVGSLCWVKQKNQAWCASSAARRARSCVSPPPPTPRTSNSARALNDRRWPAMVTYDPTTSTFSRARPTAKNTGTPARASPPSRSPRQLAASRSLAENLSAAGRHAQHAYARG